MPRSWAAWTRRSPRCPPYPSPAHLPTISYVKPAPWWQLGDRFASPAVHRTRPLPLLPPAMITEQFQKFNACRAIGVQHLGECRLQSLAGNGGPLGVEIVWPFYRSKAWLQVSALLMRKNSNANPRIHRYGSTANGLSIRNQNSIDICLEVHEASDDTVTPPPCHPYCSYNPQPSSCSPTPQSSSCSYTWT